MMLKEFTIVTLTQEVLDDLLRAGVIDDPRTMESLTKHELEGFRIEVSEDDIQAYPTLGEIEVICRSCRGHGELVYNPRPGSSPENEIGVNCPHCDGYGDLPLWRAFDAPSDPEVALEGYLQDRSEPPDWPD